MKLLLALLRYAAGAALAAIALYAWWWETTGRRERQRELNRLEDARIREWRRERRRRPRG